LGLALLAVIIYPFMLDPFQANIVPCYFKELTGADCPTCGMSRSIYEFSRFRAAEAFSFHIAGPVLYSVSLLVFIKILIEYFLKKAVKLNISSKKISAAVFILAGFWLIYWLSRALMQI